MAAWPRGKEPPCPVCGKPIRDRNARICGECRYRPKGQEEDCQPVFVDYAEARATLLKWIGCAKEKYRGPSARKPDPARQRIAVCSDLHSPFHDKRVVAEMFEDTKGADVLVVAGDVGDSYALSRFLKYENVPIQTEQAETTAFLEQASERYPKVIVLEGNHGLSRLEKALLAKNDAEVIAAVRILTGGSFSLLAAACKQYPNIELGHMRVGRFDLDWLIQIGDAIICHAEKFSIVPGSAMRKVEEWLSDQERALRLAPWRVVMQAHTHQLGMFPWRSDKLLIETGCLCSLHGYQLTARIGGRPQRRGWWKLEQRHGQTDTDSLQMRWRNEDTAGVAA
jgi:predicted phosphodiesterase